MLNKKKEILRLISNTFANSSIHAVPNILRNESYLLKLMWIIFLLGSTGYCAYLISQSVMIYLSYNVVSLNRINSKRSIEFPIVKICSLNPFTTSFSKEFMEKSLNKSMNEKIDTNMTHKLKLINNRYMAILNAIGQDESTQSKFGYSLNQTVLSCLYNFADCSIDEDLDHIYDYYFGNCLRFNSKQQKRQSVSGWLNGLQLELVIDLTNDYNSIYSMYNGFTVIISDEINLKTLYSEGIKAPLGFSTDIILNRHLIKKMPYPYSECKQLDDVDSYDSKYYKLVFKYFNQSYRQTFCKDVCYQEALINRCNCVDLTTSPSPDPKLKQCINKTDNDCNINLWLEFIDNDLYANCDCPLECNRNYYSYTTSISNFPSEPYANYLLSNSNLESMLPKNQNLSYEYLKQRMAAINIFYNDLSENEISEDAKMVLADLISNIGGIIGLFLGIVNYL